MAGIGPGPGHRGAGYCGRPAWRTCFRCCGLPDAFPGSFRTAHGQFLRFAACLTGRPDVRSKEHDKLSPPVGFFLEAEEVSQDRHPGQARQTLSLVIVLVFHQPADDQGCPVGHHDVGRQFGRRGAGQVVARPLPGFARGGSPSAPFRHSRRTAATSGGFPCSGTGLAGWCW